MPPSSLRPTCALVLLLALVPAAMAAPEPTPAGRRRERIEALLRQSPPSIDEASALAAQAIDEAKRIDPPNGQMLAEAYLLMGVVYEARARGRARLDHLDPALELAGRAMAELRSDDVAHAPLLARAHALRGRVLRVAWRVEESWRAHAASVAETLRSGATTRELATALHATLEAIAYCPPRDDAIQARRSLMAAAQAHHAAVKPSSEAAAQAALFVGRVLSGDIERREEATKAFEAAVRGYDALGSGHAHRAARARLGQARHHWHCGDLLRARDALSDADARVARHGINNSTRRSTAGLEVWAARARRWLDRLGKGEVPAWMLRDNLAAHLLAERRLDAGWWTGTNAHFFRRCAAKASEAARSQGGETAVQALRLEAIILASFGDLERAGQRFSEALSHLNGNKRDAAHRAALRLDIGIISHARGAFSESVTHLRAAAAELEAIHGFVHKTTLDALALLGVALVRAGSIKEADALAARLLDSVRTHGPLNAWMANRANAQTAGRIARSCWTLCDALGRVADLDALAEHFPRQYINAQNSVVDQLRRTGNYSDVVSRLRSSEPTLIEADAAGQTAYLSRFPRLPTLLAEIRLSESLLDLGAYEEAFAASLDAADALDSIPSDRTIMPVFLDADLRASTLLAQLLIERGLAREAIAVGRRAHRLAGLIPGWLQQQPTAVSGIWHTAKRRDPPVWRPAEERIWRAMNTARAAEVLARAYAAVDAPEACIEVLDDAMQVVASRLGPHHPRAAELAHLRGGARLRLAQLDQAKDDEGRALEIAAASLGEGHPATAAVRAGLADVLLAQGKLSEARAAYAAVLKTTDAQLSRTHMLGIRARSGVARSLLKGGKAEQAVGPMREALQRPRGAGP